MSENDIETIKADYWKMIDGIAYGHLTDDADDEFILHHFYMNYEMHVYSKTSLCEQADSSDSKIYVMGIRQDLIEGFYEHWMLCTVPEKMNKVYFCKDCLEKVKKMI